MPTPSDPGRPPDDAATTPIGVTTLCPQCGGSMPAFETRCAGCGHQKESGLEEEQSDLLRRRLQNGVGDSYELVELLGRGGMGVVFRAKEKSLERDVALKVLAFDPLMAPEAFARFEREAKLAARLDHPHIVPIFGVGQGQGVAFYTMRIVRGGSLEDLLAREKKLAPARAVRYLREIAAALDHAHANGVVHRDIKPANIMLGDGDHIFVADFGIARAVGGDAGALTSTGVVGSPAYMAPEQWQGQAIDGRADQYALGILAYELLTGKRPYREATMHELLRMHLTEDLPDITLDLPGMSVAVREVLRRATAKEPDDRFASATEFVAALDAALSDLAIPAQMTETTQMTTASAGGVAAPPAAAAVAPPKKNRVVPAAVGVLAAGGIAIALINSRSREPVVAPPAVAAAPETVRVQQHDTVRVPTATKPETVVRNDVPPPAAGAGLAAAAATSGTPPVAQAFGYIAFFHPTLPGGEYFIDGISIQPKRPPIYQVSPGPHRVSYKSSDQPTIPDQSAVRVVAGDTARATFLPASGGGARMDSLRTRMLENQRRNQAQRARDSAAGPPRGGRGRGAQRGGQFPPGRRGDTTAARER